MFGRRRSAQTAIDPGRLAEEIGRWRASQRLVLAVVVALFPILFLVDERIETGVSPVLPGLGFFVLILVAGPFLLMELLVRRERRRDPSRTTLRLHRFQSGSKMALGLAFAWFLGWLTLGA